MATIMRTRVASDRALKVAAMEEGFRAGGRGYGDFKKELFAGIWDFFKEARERRAELEADPGYVEGVLEEGARKAQEEARRVLDRVRKAVGLD